MRQFSLKLHLRSSFASGRLITGFSMKGTSHCSFLLLSILLTNFNSTLEGSIENYISIVVFPKEGLLWLPLQRSLVIAPFVERFKEMSLF